MNYIPRYPNSWEDVSFYRTITVSKWRKIVNYQGIPRRIVILPFCSCTWISSPRQWSSFLTNIKSEDSSSHKICCCIFLLGLFGKGVKDQLWVKFITKKLSLWLSNIFLLWMLPSFTPSPFANIFLSKYTILRYRLPCFLNIPKLLTSSRTYITLSAIDVSHSLLLKGIIVLCTQSEEQKMKRWFSLLANAIYYSCTVS